MSTDNADVSDPPEFQEAKSIPSPGIAIEGIGLEVLEFHKTGSREPKPGDRIQSTVNFGLALEWVEPGKALGAEFSATMDAEDIFRVHVVFRTVLRPSAQALANVVEEKTPKYWETIGARVAPTVLFPFVRETIATATARAGIPSAILPIVFPGQLFDPDKIVLAPVTDSP